MIHAATINCSMSTLAMTAHASRSLGFTAAVGPPMHHLRPYLYRGAPGLGTRATHRRRALRERRRHHCPEALLCGTELVRSWRPSTRYSFTDVLSPVLCLHPKVHELRVRILVGPPPALADLSGLQCQPRAHHPPNRGRGTMPASAFSTSSSLGPPAARSTASALPTPATYHTAAGMLAAMAIGGRSPDSLSIENWATLMNAIRERHRSQAGLLHQIEQAVHRGDAPQALHDRLCQMGRPDDAVTALNYGVVYAEFSRRSLRTRRTS